MKIIQKLYDKPLHLIFIGVYPLLALYLFNIEETPFFAISRSLFFSLIAAFVAYTFFLLVFTRWDLVIYSKKALILLGFAILLCIIYPVFRSLVLNAAHLTIGKHRYLIPIWGMLFLSGFVVVMGRKNLAGFLTTILAWEKAALATSLFLFLFYIYGHIFNLLYYDPSKGNKYLFAQYQNLMIILLVVFILGLVFIVFLKTPRTANWWLNTISTILIGMTVLQIAFFFLGKTSKNETTLPTTTGSEKILRSSSSDPDVYYIVLDAYSREDVLRNNLHLDTSDFINELTKMGFVIAPCSNSNYSFTDSSMASTFNMDYLDNLDIPSFRNGNTSTSSLEPFIKHSLVRRKFEELGYSTVTFKVVNPYLDITDSTYYYDFSKDTASINKAETVLFYFLFLQTTALRPYLDYLDWQSTLHPNSPPLSHEWIPVGSAFSDRNYHQYRLTLYNLTALEKTPDLPGKKFIYAHLIITHEPFVFTPDGKFRYPVTGDPDGYIDQVRFANDRVIKIIKTIIDRSKTPPIIILQGDHGWTVGPLRNQNLSAFFLPNNDGRLIYPEITNVNTFRIIFNKYFKGTYPLLPDIVYVTESGSAKNYLPIPSSCPK